MPWSAAEGKTELMGLLRKSVPRSAPVLDVGPGAGAYGELLRGDGYELVDAVEVFGPYVARFGLQSKYRSVIVSDIRQFTPAIPYECAILGDVLEHLTVADAQALIGRLPILCRYALVSIPWNYAQGASEGNAAEEHLQPDLTEATMRQRYPALRLHFRGTIVGIYDWRL